MPIDYSRFVGRGWAIFSHHRVLWLLGFVMALGAAAVAPASVVPSLASVGFVRGAAAGGAPPTPAALWSQYSGLVIGGAVLLGLLTLALSFLSASGEAALISAVDQIERTGQTPRFGTAWRRGTRRLGPLWLLSLLVGVISFGAVALAAIPALLAGIDVFNRVAANPNNPRLGGGFTLGMACSGLLFLPVMVGTVVLSFIRQLAAQAIVLDGAGVLAALARGWRLLRQNVAPALVIVLITYVASYVTSFILAPVTAAFIVPVFALGMFQSAEATSSGLLLVLISGGGVLYGVIVAAVSGLLAAFTTVLWTLLYRYRRDMPNSDLAPRTVATYGTAPYTLVPGVLPGTAPPPYPLTPPAAPSPRDPGHGF